MRKTTPETAIKRQIKDYLRHMGWYVFPVLQGMGAHRGISDLISVKDGVVLFIEVKTLTGRLSEHQEKFKAEITERGGHYLVARSWEDVSHYIVSML